MTNEQLIAAEMAAVSKGKTVSDACQALRAAGVEITKELKADLKAARPAPGTIIEITRAVAVRYVTYGVGPVHVTVNGKRHENVSACEFGLYAAENAIYETTAE